MSLPEHATLAQLLNARSAEPARAADIDAFLDRGCGLSYVHWAVDGRDNARPCRDETSTEKRAKTPRVLDQPLLRRLKVQRDHRVAEDRQPDQPDEPAERRRAEARPRTCREQGLESGA